MQDTRMKTHISGDQISLKCAYICFLFRNSSFLKNILIEIWSVF